MTKLDELQKLQNLRESGAISESEFLRLKESLLQNGITFEESVKNISNSIDENTWCMFIHFSQLLAFALPLVGLIVPIILWQMKKDESELIDAHGKMVMNWIISSLIYLVISGILCLILIGYPLLLGLIALEVIFPIIGGIRAKEGIKWKYPLTISFIS
jgi:uncharacterized Tic20 family protein